MAGSWAWMPIRRGARSGVEALKSHRFCQIGLLYEKPTFQSSFTSKSRPTWKPAPQNGRAFVAAGKVGRPKASLGPGAKKAGEKLVVPAVIMGPPATASRSVTCKDAIGLIAKSDMFAKIGPNPKNLGG